MASPPISPPRASTTSPTATSSKIASAGPSAGAPASPPHDKSKGGWGSNFWVTLSDPQSGAEFYACPATGECSWDPPEGNFVLPRSTTGEWWEIDDPSTGLSYYHHTATGETSWTKPDGEFVIPLGLIQNTTMGKRLSAAYLSNRASMIEPDFALLMNHGERDKKGSDHAERLTPPATPTIDSPTSPRSGGRVAFADSPLVSVSPPTPNMRNRSPAHPQKHQHQQNGRTGTPSNNNGSSRTPSHRPPVSGHPMPVMTEFGVGTDLIGNTHHKKPFSASASASSYRNPTPKPRTTPNTPVSTNPNQRSNSAFSSPASGPVSPSPERMRSKSSGALRASTLPPSPATYSGPPAPSLPPFGKEEGSLLAAAELFAGSSGYNYHGSASPLGPPVELKSAPPSSFGGRKSMSAVRERERDRDMSPSPAPPMAPFYANSKASGSTSSLGKLLTPRGLGMRSRSDTAGSSKSGHSSATHTPTSPRPPLNGRTISAPVVDAAAAKRMAPVLRGDAIFVELKKGFESEEHVEFPQELKEDIQQFAGSDFARRYFATHSTGLIFKRRVPMEKMMSWQKTPLTNPLLNLSQRHLHRDAVRMFRVIQKVMGDVTAPLTGLNSAKEEERWLLGACLTHGELRDEAYCQVVKQLRANTNPQSVFQGWQLLCVLLVTFPPSKDFETYLQSFLERHMGQAEGRIDVMAKYCLKKLPLISRKGPRGRPLTLPEIDSACDAAFNPSTFGEPLDAIMRLQSRTYPHERVPIILPFLADAIIALGGTRTEGIFRVPGDGDAVADLKLRIDRGFYTLDGIDDPHVPASVLKLWLRELQTPLVPDEMYNECVAAGAADDAIGAVQLVARLPTHHRRVLAFIISFLQLFLEVRATAATKMNAPNLALVMAPNLVRCASESVAVVFANAAHEQKFVLNLLLNLQCDSIDPDYRPQHGRGAAAKNGKGRA